jgi:sugar transferase (PEP-CTERM/EpsH1 system associated)
MSAVLTESLPPILYVVHRIPYPPDKGDRIRTFHVLRFLAQRSRVSLACLADEPVDNTVVAALWGYCERVKVVRVERGTRLVGAARSFLSGRTGTEGAFDSPALREVVKRWATETDFQAALASSSGMVPYLGLTELRGVPAVVDLIDVDSQKWFDYAAASRGPAARFYAAEGRRLRDLERRLPAWVRAVTLVSEPEAELYRAFAGSAPVHAIGNGVDLDYYRPQPRAAEEGCVFVGALDYRPNVDAACWFCDAVWPEVSRRHPGMRLSLVGRRPVAAVRRLAKVPGVEVVGQVSDVRPYLARAALVVVPLRIARGIQNKVLEALAMGKAVVASPQALEGLSVTAGVHAYSASTPQDWTEAVACLLDHPTRRQQLGLAGRAYVEGHHRWDRCLEPFGPLLGLTAGTGTAEALPAALSASAAPH